jgi:uncharacterized protein (TIGR02302 family)
MLPGVAHLAILVLLGLTLLLALFRARAAFRLPGYVAARRRIEVASGTSHRPLATIDDDLASRDDAVSRAIWATHRARALAAAKALRAGWPQPGLPRRDPHALRVLLVLVLVIGAVGAGADSWSRVVRAVSPGASLPTFPPGALDLWITPPAYTGIAPILPQQAAAAPGQPANAQPPELAIPAGSVLLAQVTGGRGTPEIVIDDQRTAFESVDDRAFRATTTLTAGSRLTIRQGSTTLASWPIRVIPDNAPTVEFPRSPMPTLRQALRIDYRAHDDYGIASVVALVQRAQRPDGVPDETIELPLPLSGPRLREAEGTSFHDLTAHPWAGLPVKVRLRATDTGNQVGESPEIAIVLPERAFRHPVARAIVEQRRQLVADPANRVPVSRMLLAIGSEPARFYDDVVVFLALRMGAVRLLRSATSETSVAVQQLLWDTALRIEDGNLSLAERDLRALQQRLQDALANNAPDAEIDRMVQELREAIDRYLRAMMEQAQRNPQDLQRQPNERNAQRVERNDLQRMLEQARQLARTGAREAARDMLQRLQEMLENLRAQAQNQPGEGGEQGGEGQQMLQSLQELMNRQQQLTDRSFRRSQQNRPGQSRPGQPGQPGRQPGQQAQPGQGGEDGGEDAGEQEAVRRELGEIMRQLGEMMGDVPGGFGRSERAMRDAGEALSRGNAGRALRPQMDALDQLRAGARELVQRLQDQMAQGEGEGEQGEPNMETMNGRDPAGRPLNGLGGMDGRDVRIPEEAEVQRSREILDELMRRAGERFRPRLEREYIDRLLKRF